MASSKLVNKSKKIKVEKNQNPENEVKTLSKRYFHISIDKLADAFEKQFLNDLPNLGSNKSSTNKKEREDLQKE